MAAAAAATAAAPAAHSTAFLPSPSRGVSLSSPHLSLHLPITTTTTTKTLRFSQTRHLSSSSLSPRKTLHGLFSSATVTAVADDNSSPPAAAAPTFHGPCYVLGDNIDTDQIIPAEHLTLVPSKPDEYRKLGSFALIGLPSAIYPIPFVDPGNLTTRFPIIIAGANFGCGSSREHAPVALGAAGVRAVIAESYARIFFRNSVATGEVYPVESEDVRLCRECSTGDIITVDLAENVLTNHSTGKCYQLKPVGDAGPVIEAGGIFAYARKTGMIPSEASTVAD